MKICGCFSPVSQRVKALFQRREEPERILEIGPPTNFRREEFTIPLSDEDTLNRHDSHGVIAEKEAAQSSIVDRKTSTSTRDQLRAKIFKLGSRLAV
ncbi:uncharacterized protein TRUGW13939_05167 [Talaromyces rugulosus]|uniref:Uncharacterized protein n=1 Tax=Talaromyces rugulosus TaxID=121627 RepID=A0A7H8QVP4_TALRU|nr:uncharacterized protein TRUGW13939_05167 [Talaromyces rugulosus]QKX58047.1 hypothetical protein TRUGW13939_05167 [Talaromyces rugulosus]